MIKRGQISAFIILAIIILVIAISIFFLTKTKQSTSNLDSVLSKMGILSQAKDLEISIQECLKQTVESALIVIGIQGGYYNPPEDLSKYYDLEWTFIPYYYDRGSFLQPLTKKIESEIKDYLDENLESCFWEINYQDFQLSYENSDSGVKIEKGKVLITSNLQIKIEKDQTTELINLKNYPVSIPSKLYEIIEVATYITDSHKEDSEMICVSCIADMAEERQIYVDIRNFGEETSITLNILSENQTSSEPYIFEFLNRY